MWAVFAGASSGVLMALAFPPADLGALAFFALAPLAIVFRSGRLRLIAAAAAAFGLVFFGMLLEWILLFGWAAFVSLILVQTWWVVVALVVAITLRDRLGPRLGVLAFPIGIVAGEYLRAHLPFTGFTWGGLGYTQHDATVILRLASYTGVWGISFLVAASGALVGEGIVRVRNGWVKAVSPMVIGSVVTLAVIALPMVEPDGHEATIAAIQGNQPEDPSAPGSDDESVLLNHTALTATIPSRVSLVVWPEGAGGSDPLDRPELRVPLIEAIAATRAPFLVGARIEAGDTHFRNRSLFFESDGTLQDFYDKTRLVPYGEFVPGRRFLEPLFEQLQQVPKDGIPGTRLTIFEIPEGKFASVICFESTFPDLVASFVRKGAGFLTVITDNASFERTAASAQHLTFSQLRAAENRIWIAHVAVSGISGVVAPDGRVISRTELFEPATLVQKLKFATRPTLYARWGDWFPILGVSALGISLLSAGWARLRRR